MKREKRLIALIIVALILMGTAAGCAKNVTIEIPPAEYGIPSDDATILIDLALEMVPLTASPAMFSVAMPSATGTLTRANDKAIIDYSNSSDGYIMVKYMNATTKELRVLITGPNNTRYQYSLKKNATYEVYPLSAGDGKYEITVCEQVSESKFAVAVSATITVKLTDEFAPFLLPNQYVNYTENSKVVAKAADLVKNANTLMEKISAVYNFVVSNLTYDKELAQNVKPGYLPDVDAVMERGKGICFDYAAVMAAMLRSQKVPTRLVIGYAGTVYHAWIDVYSETEGWINSVIFFDGQSWKLMDPTFASSSNGSESVMQYIGDGKNYSARYIY